MAGTQNTPIRLLLLGAVRQLGRAHGYRIRSELESWGATDWSIVKPGSIYAGLKQLAKEDLLRAHGSGASAAGGPPRADYSLTPAGEAAFFELLRTALRSHTQPTGVLMAGLGFITALPRAEAIGLLAERADAFAEWQRGVADYWTPDASSAEWGAVGEVMRLWTDASAWNRTWTLDLIKRLRAGELIMADDR
ncbi:PadR family transcriptional regulator [Microlunatus speluncae]|uniref:PadR family transcriptional regulator n=1 Tax=Microlunatus speluncae TaxID=2594267 RepID=UPI0012667EA4|nr:PadR family transcriptional regulator [Microlunatus speluncae]